MATNSDYPCICIWKLRSSCTVLYTPLHVRYSMWRCHSRKPVPFRSYFKREFDLSYSPELTRLSSFQMLSFSPGLLKKRESIIRTVKLSWVQGGARKLYMHPLLEDPTKYSLTLTGYSLFRERGTMMSGKVLSQLERVKLGKN